MAKNQEIDHNGFFDNDGVKIMQALNLVIVGPPQSGKSTLIHSISEVPIARLETEVYEKTARGQPRRRLVMFDFGKLTVDPNLALYIFGQPGSWHFRFGHELLMRKILGYVLMIDSADPTSFAEAQSYIDLFNKKADAPWIIAANKQDHPDALSLDDLKTHLTIPPLIPFVPCRATDSTAVKQVLIQLLYLVLPL